MIIIGRKLKFGTPTKILTIRVPEKFFEAIKKKIEKIVNKKRPLGELNYGIDLINQYSDLSLNIIELMRNDVIEDYPESTKEYILGCMKEVRDFLENQLKNNQEKIINIPEDDSEKTKVKIEKFKIDQFENELEVEFNYLEQLRNVAKQVFRFMKREKLEKFSNRTGEMAMEIMIKTQKFLNKELENVKDNKNYNLIKKRKNIIDVHLD